MQSRRGNDHEIALGTDLVVRVADLAAAQDLRHLDSAAANVADNASNICSFPAL